MFVKDVALESTIIKFHDREPYSFYKIAGFARLQKLQRFRDYMTFKKTGRAESELAVLKVS